MYMQQHPSAALVASWEAAFESWFRVELAATLTTVGVSQDQIAFRCPYPQSRERADLLVTLKSPIPFELKCFVCGADAKKLSAFPEQIKRLERYVQNRAFSQAVAFATLFGYTDARERGLLSFFAPAWKLVGPLRVLDGHPLKFVLAEIRRTPN
jgi:hypothetical protein